MTENLPIFSYEVKTYLDHLLPSLWISRGGTENLSCRSADINYLDSYLQGHLKVLYQEKAETRDPFHRHILAAPTCVKHKTILMT
jgi:hypothetical protein